MNDNFDTETLKKTYKIKSNYENILNLLGENKDRKQQDARLLYVGMTRAQECLLMTSSNESEFCSRIQSVI